MTEAVRILEFYGQILRKGATYMIESLAQPEPNQKEIDAEAAELLRDTFCFDAELLRDTFCFEHNKPMEQDPYDGVWYCAECEADDVIYRVHPTSPNEGKF
jgi:hypothetical protein